MAQDTGLPDIQLDSDSLYREEMFTDRRAGTIRRLTPVTADGGTDAARPVLFSGQTQLLTPTGVLPLGFEIEATSLAEAIQKFPAAVKEALEQAIEEAREYRRESASSHRSARCRRRHGRRSAAGRRQDQAVKAGAARALVEPSGSEVVDIRVLLGAGVGTAASSSASPGIACFPVTHRPDPPSGSARCRRVDQERPQTIRSIGRTWGRTAAAPSIPPTQWQQISVKGTSTSVWVGRCSMPCHSRKRRLQR